MLQRIGRASACVAVVVMVAVAAFTSGQMVRPESGEKQSRRIGGGVLFEFDRAALTALGWEVLIRGDGDSEEAGHRLSSAIQSTSTLSVESVSGIFRDISSATIETHGAVLLTDGERRVVLGNLTIAKSADGLWTVRDGLNEDQPDRIVFELSSVTIDAPAGRQEMRIAGELTIAESLTGEWDLAQASGTVIGRVLITAQPVDAEQAPLDTAQAVLSQTEDVDTTAVVIGPDVIVGNLYQVASYGSSGGISAFAVGTVSCNIGDVWLNWISNTNQHPVIGQGMFRLKNDRFEHVGQSWLKHGFFALSESLCFSDCQATNGSHLGVHCSDPYSASLNGTQSNLGPKYPVDAHTGYFPYPLASPPYSGIIARRLQVRNSDLDPSLNGGGLYFVEGHYVTPDDAAASNQNNNASYRRVTVSGSGSSWTLSLTGTTQRQQAAIRAWQDTDGTVTETDVQVPGEGLFIVSAKATDLGTGYWHYEYAVQNLNSHRSCRAFSVPIDPTGKILNIGFHDVDYHSGEPYPGTDWTAIVDNGSMTWSTSEYGVNPSANALRWGTLYNFRFDANRAPQTTSVTLGLFRPDTLMEVAGNTIGPRTVPPDCNGNGIPDNQDILNGTSQDCDGDGIPDECESFTPAAVQVATGLNNPVYVTSPPGDLNRLFMVEQGGRIKVLSGGSVLATPFLDISGLVSTDVEQGLLSTAFDPDYSINGQFFVNYTNVAGDTVIARYSVTGDPNVADPISAVILKTIAQPASYHNGGQLQFGPDGFLYVGMGDGGGQNDPFNRSQDPGNLLGKMLRLDVDSPPAYIPLTNPYQGEGLPLDEIWATGFRNPWRFSFDRETGDMYIADVGEAAWEEIDFQPASGLGGQNYGWRCMEGTNCTGLSGCTCNSPSLTLPIVEYPHAGGDCSVTGGYVYRGCALPNLLGTYFYADFCSGAIRSFRYVGGAVTGMQDRTTQLTPAEGPIGSIASFGEDAAGELYIVSHAGSIYKIVPQGPAAPVCGNGVVESDEQCDDGNTLPGDGCSATCQVENGPPHDHCANALPVGDGFFAFNTSGADTDGPNESAICNVGVSSVGSDIWYCYTPPCTGTVTVSLCGSSYDTMLAVYDGCTCPAVPSAMDCDDDTCDLQSVISFAATACERYLIRVGGYEGVQGAGLLTVTCQPDPIVNDCNANGIEDATEIACGAATDNNGNGIPDICEVTGDYIRGGRLYDRWWSAIAAPAPTTNHPLWQYRPDQTSNAATGSTTWRCTECHGWDYKGVDGEFATGPHRTGFPGVLGTSLGAASLFGFLKEPPNNGGGGGVPNGHNYGSVLADEQIDDLVAFVLGGVIDTDAYVNATSGVFLGDPAVGETHYATGGTLSQCISCHGGDGAAINFGTPQEPEYLGTVAVYEPYHFLHRARMGFPGTPMPGWLANGGTDQGVADIGRYAQLSFPVDCLDSSQCDDGVACTDDRCDASRWCVFTANDALCPDDGVFCNGTEICNDVLGCVASGNPCMTPSACDEDTANCGCNTPEVVAAGPRYLAIMSQPSAAFIPMRLLVTPNCPLGVGKYVGAPRGPYNIAKPVSDPASAANLTPVQWGGTVYVTGTDIAPEVEYGVQADCGQVGRPALTTAAIAETPRWGDVIGWLPSGGYTPPDGVVDGMDISGVVDAFKILLGAPPLYAADLYGCVPNQIIDGLDISGVIDAFKGFPYPQPGCPGPCW